MGFYLAVSAADARSNAVTRPRLLWLEGIDRTQKQADEKSLQEKRDKTRSSHRRRQKLMRHNSAYDIDEIFSPSQSTSAISATGVRLPVSPFSQNISRLKFIHPCPRQSLRRYVSIYLPGYLPPSFHVSSDAGT
ncbi:hypothetical protein KCP75_10240 [Salmonella enterica subsp. enterica]|nr:hypothetical protein KCP75_10240 [Salmonella enterica subsp. enterica]